MQTPKRPGRRAKVIPGEGVRPERIEEGKRICAELRSGNDALFVEMMRRPEMTKGDAVVAVRRAAPPAPRASRESSPRSLSWPDAFFPRDLDRMQRAYDTARHHVAVANDERRQQAMAKVVLAAYQSGERSEVVLISKALAAVRNA